MPMYSHTYNLFPVDLSRKQLVASEWMTGEETQYNSANYSD